MKMSPTIWPGMKRQVLVPVDRRRLFPRRRPVVRVPETVDDVVGEDARLADRQELLVVLTVIRKGRKRFRVDEEQLGVVLRVAGEQRIGAREVDVDPAVERTELRALRELRLPERLLPGGVVDGGDRNQIEIG